jgi:hypothetical protein
MSNEFNELFFYADPNYKRYSANKKINSKYLLLYLFFGAITTGLVLVGIFSHRFF